MILPCISVMINSKLATDSSTESVNELDVGWSVYLNGMQTDYDQFAGELGQIGEYIQSQQLAHEN